MPSTQKIKLFVAIPTLGQMTDTTVYALRELERLYADRIEFIWPKLCVRRIFHDFARNAMVEEFLASEADILWFLDSDVSPPTDVLDIVLAHEKWDLAGAPYPVFMTPTGSDRPAVVFTVYDGKNVNGGGLAAANVPSSGESYVDGVGTGCMFIKRAVFGKLSKPYFDFTYDASTRCLTGGEDLRFCKKVVALGYKFYINYALACRHQKTVCLLEVNNYAQQYAKNSLEAYAAEVKEKVQGLAAEVKRLRAVEKELQDLKNGRKDLRSASGLILKP